MLKAIVRKYFFSLVLFGAGLFIAIGYTQAQTTLPGKNVGKTNALMPKLAPKMKNAKRVRFASSVWNVQCQPNVKTKKLVCVLFKTVKTIKSKKLILRASISAAPHRFIIHLPHRLDLTAGVGLKINSGKPIIMAFKTSTRRGVFTDYKLSDTLLSAMKKEGKMVITVKALSGQKIAIPLSLAGFAVSFEKLK